MTNKNLLFLLLLAACTTKNERAIQAYFDVSGFIEHQVSMLHEKDAQIRKTVKFGEETETTTVSDLDSTQWQKALRIFKEHDINKPVLVDAYQKDYGQLDQGSEFTRYTLMDSTSSGVKSMEIVYDSNGQVSTWSSSFQEENLLYCNFRELMLTTGEGGVLNNYLVRGYHKLIFKDTVYYQLEVNVEY